MQEGTGFNIVGLGTLRECGTAAAWQETARWLIVEWGYTLEELLALRRDPMYDEHRFEDSPFEGPTFALEPNERSTATQTLGEWAADHGLDPRVGLEGVVPDPRVEGWRRLLREELESARADPDFIVSWVYSDEIRRRTGHMLPIGSYGLIHGAVRPFKGLPDVEVYQHCFNGPMGDKDEDLYFVLRTKKPTPGFHM